MKQLLFALILFSVGCSFAQTDSVILDEVQVMAYPGKLRLLQLPATITEVDSTTLKIQHPQSLLPALNTVAGARMEERSPGSYRLAIRGNILRSPFGVRSVKVYLDEFSLTNAGGETYLNLIDNGSIRRAEIIKGPDGSFFGANSGGVLRLYNHDRGMDSSSLAAAITVGSFGLIKPELQFSKLTRGGTQYSGFVAWQKSDGYRDHSRMDRKFFQLCNRRGYNKGETRVLFFYSDLYYQTPGGLTYEQMQQDPTRARHPGILPGTEIQKAAVYNRSFFGGVVNEYNFTDNLKHIIAVSGMQTRFENPFITNYEVRDENNFSLRTRIEYTILKNDQVSIRTDMGGEWQELSSDIINYGNISGVKGLMLADDHVAARQAFAFVATEISLAKKLIINGAISINANRIQIERKHPGEGTSERNLDPEFLPRLATSYLINKHLTWRGIISKGYSAPSVQELRPSGYMLNNRLKAEYGWNYETGLRYMSTNRRVNIDLTAFYYRLRNAIVRTTDTSGNEMYQNSDGTIQRGAELQVAVELLKRNNTRFLRALKLYNAATVYRFRFENYFLSGIAVPVKGPITGVPNENLISGIYFEFPLGFFLFVQHQFVSAIPLSSLGPFTTPYNTFYSKIGWSKNLRNTVLTASAGVDNITNQQYSLGNDLDAAGGRYYNPSPTRNYFLQLALVFH